MSTGANDDPNFSVEAEACYELLASQEEIYLEEREEELHVFLDSCIPSPLPTGSMTDANDGVRAPENLDELLDNAAKELIIGDAHDRLRKEELWEMLKLI